MWQGNFMTFLLILAFICICGRTDKIVLDAHEDLYKDKSLDEA